MNTHVCTHTYIHSAQTTSVLPEAMFEPWGLVASDHNKHMPRRICGHLLKPC